jgi:hypothetical protein
MQFRIEDLFKSVKKCKLKQEHGLLLVSICFSFIQFVYNFENVRKVI